MNKILFFFLIIVLIGFSSCGEDIPEKTEFTNGVIVVNQGAFLSGTGTLTFKERGATTPIHNIYTMNNEGSFLGNVAQSMIEFKNNNFIAINNGGKVVVCEEDNFCLTDTIENINQGRYFATNSDKLYLSSWGMTGSDGGIYEIDGSNFSVKNFISLGNGPEGMVFVNDLLYVAKGGGFSRDSVLVIIDTDDNSTVEELVIGDNPELVVKDNDDNVYVICNGYTDFGDPANNTGGKLVKISNQEIEWSLDLPNGSNRLAIDKANGFLYFNSLGKVVKQDITSSTLSTTEVIATSAYALGFDEDEQNLYVGDAKDFSSQGEVVVISKDDTEVSRFSAGIIPSYFHFK